MHTMIDQGQISQQESQLLKPILHALQNLLLQDTKNRSVSIFTYLLINGLIRVIILIQNIRLPLNECTFYNHTLFTTMINFKEFLLFYPTCPICHLYIRLNLSCNYVPAIIHQQCLWHSRHHTCHKADPTNVSEYYIVGQEIIKKL